MEFIDIVDENGNPTNEVLSKEDTHKLGKWHNTAHVWIYNSKKELLIQKRSLNKDTCPGMWDISVAGHISAGENIVKGAERETLEEVGLKLNLINLQEMFILKESHFNKKMDWNNNEFHHVFCYKFDGSINDFTIQEEELEEIRFITIENLISELSTQNKLETFAGNKEYYFRVIDFINKI